MKFIQGLICRIRGHTWSRTIRVNPTQGSRRCMRCHKPNTVQMRTPYSRKKAAEATGAQTRG